MVLETAPPQMRPDLTGLPNSRGDLGRSRKESAERDQTRPDQTSIDPSVVGGNAETFTFAASSGSESSVAITSTSSYRHGTSRVFPS